MLSRGKLIITILTFSVIAFVACDVTSEKALDESLEAVPNVTAIGGAQNATIRVNNGSSSNFNVDIQNVEWNTLISNGEREAYCIAWQDPISRNDATYEGVGVYSTAGDEQFAEINRLFSMKNEIMKNDPELTWREIQVAVWVLTPFQEFDMNMPVNELPEEVRRNGQPNFDKGKVQDIVDLVRSRSAGKTISFPGMANSTSDDYEKTMCVIGTNEDTQTLIVPCDETAFAYGGDYGADYTGVAGIPGEDGYANCFPEDDYDKTISRWGWSNGLLGEGRYKFPLYAGAGQCILSKGQYSGDVIIDYSGDKVTVTFTAADGTSFNETHLHIGSEKLPKKNDKYTAAPGSYLNNDDVKTTSDTEVVYEVTGVSGDIYVVAHAVMAGYEAPETE